MRNAIDCRSQIIRGDDLIAVRQTEQTSVRFGAKACRKEEDGVSQAVESEDRDDNLKV